MDLILKKLRTPNLVFIGKVNYYPDKMDWITYDIKDCVYKNMDYLRESGHKRIAYMGGFDNEDTPPDFSKFAYFEQYMNSHPELTFAGSMVGEHGVENGSRMMNQWLDENRELPDAFLISNDPIAIGAIKTLNEHSIQVPDMVSVTAINGDSSGTFSFPTLSTVDVHTYEMGKEAVAVLEERIRHRRTLAKKVEFQAELVRWGSVKKMSGN
ncbi:hypothetical protein ADH76_30520 [Enterocloster clostridioformis]|uniref:substrate-binding domain-containing protein n=1 Tax=Enterocloster clostridioformis TaxID=1531 RepID=UPI00080C3EAE|nr:substrate-binding domain-containing protein [Enterocloster clostridioformis]ANU47056.1 hypothetical protein A4V08_15840 [Lachnoclostridium sp. YL32]NDO32633.1 hypothetical protein [Enterocloster clostridioformis]OXE62898.1 hypothetical protein ADH76_30520 [Enterocloster clostridioformis]QQQ98233.1 substrate-binding domain-containing protein [Enterocloster clostridioformis]